MKDSQTNFALNPYKEFAGTVADGQTYTIYYLYSFVQILSLSATTGVTLRFGASGTPSTIVGAGISYQTPDGQSLDRLDIINNSGGTLTFNFGLCLGKINDSRFTTSSVITTKEPVPTFRTTADATLSTTAAIVLAADTSRHEAIVTNTDATILVYVGDSNVTNTTRRGIVLKPGQSTTIQSSANIYAVAASGTPIVSLAETVY